MVIKRKTTKRKTSVSKRKTVNTQYGKELSISERTKILKSIRQADKQFKTIPLKTRKSLGITRTNFRKEFKTEIKYIRKKK